MTSELSIPPVGYRRLQSVMAAPPVTTRSRNFDRREDELLLDLVKKYGTDSWSTIANELGTRTARQCRNRYQDFLAPGLNKSPWTPEEDELLKRQYEEIGPRWAVLRSFFPGRTDLNIKNRFGFLARNRADVRELKNKFLAEHRGITADDSKRRRRKDDSQYDTRLFTVDSFFEALPYFVKRCLFLETILRENQIPFPPEGVCDEKQWIQQEHLMGHDDDVTGADQLPPIPEPETNEKN